MSSSTQMRTIARHVGLRSALKKGVGVLGFDAVKRNFYSPIPDWRSMPESTWTTPSAMRDIAFDVDAQLAFLEGELAPYVAEFTPPAEAPEGEVAYHYRNGFFQGVDADVLYAMVRHLKPRRVLELGSGYSSLIIGMANVANGRDGRGFQHDVYDPFSRPDLQPAIRAAADLHLVSANDVPAAAVEALEPGDVLFVDTTHTVKLGSDVNHVVFEVLPRLKPGVVVHFHDVFLPYEYPREWFTWPEVYWAEQYLLQAFLMHNDAWETVLGVHALVRDRIDAVAAVVPALAEAQHPGSYWLRRVR